MFCRYDSSAGTFTVPPGGDDFYYFSVYLFVWGELAAYFDVTLNGELICTAGSDLTSSHGGDQELTTCSAVTYAVEGTHENVLTESVYIFTCLLKLTSDHLPLCHTGDVIQVVYRTGTNTNPLRVHTAYYWNGFTGFRI